MEYLISTCSANRKFQRGIIILTLIISVIMIFISPYSVDNISYYFKYAQEVAHSHGNLLYRDIELNYSPLPVYLYSLVFLLTNDLAPNYVFLLIIFVFILGSSIIIYVILRRFRISQFFSIIFSCIFILASFGLDISSTEHFVVFFELIMFWFLLRDKKGSFILAGISAFLAFYSKQYGLLSIAMGMFYFIYSRSQLKKIVWFLIGLIIPLVIIELIYFLSDSGFSVFEMLGKLLFPKDSEVELTGSFYSLIGLSISFLQFILIVPYFILALYLFFAKRLFKNKIITFLLLFIISNFIPLIIAYYFHYYLLALPFVILFAAFVLNEYIQNVTVHKYIVTMFLCIGVIASIFAFLKVEQIDGKWRMRRQLTFKPDKELIEDSGRLNTIVPKGSKVFIVDFVFYYYPADFYSIDLQHLGYTWGQQHDLNYVLKYFDKGEYLIIRANTREQFKEYLDYILAIKSQDSNLNVIRWEGKFRKNQLFYILKKNN